MVASRYQCCLAFFGGLLKNVRGQIPVLFAHLHIKVFELSSRLSGFFLDHGWKQIQGLSPDTSRVLHILSVVLEGIV